MDGPIVSPILTAIAYAPIALFAESLRVQRAMVASILSQSSIAPAITGCIRDLDRLWQLDDVQLFGNFEDERNACVTSVKHGNSFPLHNQTVLQLAGVLREKSSAAGAIVPYEAAVGEGFRTRRETVIHLTFVLPHEAGMDISRFSWLQGLCWAVTLVEAAGPIVMAVYMAIWRDVKGVILMVGFSLSTLILAVLRVSTHPVIANQNEISKFRKDIAKGVGTLDVHVIANDWNDRHLNVVCGYTSHLHALTNIPMTISRPRLLLWASRGLAIVLLVQAASLASLMGKKETAWLSLTWLAIYILMSIPPYILNAYCSASTYDSHTATLTRVQPIYFSCRRAALLFISLLPASKQAYVDEWAWMNVFIPDNERRSVWKSRIKSLDFVTLEINPGLGEGHLTEEVASDYQKSKDILKEAKSAYCNPRVLEPLLSYKQCVGLGKVWK